MAAATAEAPTGRRQCARLLQVQRALSSAQTHAAVVSAGATPAATLAEFSDFEVPEELVAQRPAQPRDSSKMIVLHRDTGTIEHRIVSELPQILAAQPEKFKICVNNSKVVDCKLEAKWSSDGLPQVLYLLERTEIGVEADAGGRMYSRWLVSGEGVSAERNGDTLQLDDSELVGALVVDAMHMDAADGVMDFCFPAAESTAGRIDEELARKARVPLPPYVTATDGEGEYQTMFASSDGSVAAPTAGLVRTQSVCRSLWSLERF